MTLRMPLHSITIPSHNFSFVVASSCLKFRLRLRGLCLFRSDSSTNIRGKQESHANTNRQKSQPAGRFFGRTPISSRTQPFPENANTIANASIRPPFHSFFGRDRNAVNQLIASCSSNPHHGKIMDPGEKLDTLETRVCLPEISSTTFHRVNLRYYLLIFGNTSAKSGAFAL